MFLVSAENGAGLDKITNITNAKSYFVLKVISDKSYSVVKVFWLSGNKSC